MFMTLVADYNLSRSKTRSCAALPLQFFFNL
ncbi:hypothetical protein CGRA01v4_11117 [Colletotrichum graminicola]|nr:hypothetical protein CGRA01v4_11117 [Colletotrichum graminicola]